MSIFGTVNTTDVKDTEIVDPPTDSISCMSFSPVADYLAVGSWSHEVRLYEIGPQGQSQGKAMYKHEGPVLSVCWNKEGNKVFSGGMDKAARMFDIQTNQSTQVGAHDDAVKCVRWVDAQAEFLLQKLGQDYQYWDLRHRLRGKVDLPTMLSMDVVYPLLVVATADQQVLAYDLNNPTAVFRTIASPLKLQTRVVSCFPTGKGFGIGSIEGRVAMQYIDEKEAGNNFSFRCHRKEQAVSRNNTHIFSVNDISFHPVHGTFSTAGGDGVVSFWDGDSKTRLKSLEAVPGPISCTAFNKTGSLFAYAVSYDWSKGHSGMTPDHPNKIMIHQTKDDEVKRRPRK
ncbi:poly(A)+ RNA export protein [Rhizoctonia solani AG-3 Rhs1AP]|uniref:Poly(A)+ RNA export protein n=1 Tax=Rhizoctonia solani AG-3 Rhs1AP TaxID=1086054 RepID=A0A0A1UIM5_9AGAM|nr:poly(A)+ RNA export protein [Rhizoctonia solani AG-3 Rhs1AP]